MPYPVTCSLATSSPTNLRTVPRRQKIHVLSHTVTLFTTGRGILFPRFRHVARQHSVSRSPNTPLLWMPSPVLDMARASGERGAAPCSLIMQLRDNMTDK